MTPHLKLLAEGYFHQDYDLDFPDSESVVRGYAEREGEVATRALTREIDSLLATAMSESQYEALWSEQWLASYDPTVDGWAYRDWFAHVKDLVSEAGSVDNTD
jgi:hypothetical protein